MPCKLCDKWWARRWADCDAWDRAASNESDLWSGDTIPNRALIEQAFSVEESDPAAALLLYLEAAEAGSAFAMSAAAWHYQTGTAVTADFDQAEHYHRRAIEAGSWLATLDYARLLADRNAHDRCDAVLEDGVASDFLPSCFWLAYLRYQRRPVRAVCREIRPLLDHAAAGGHPMAKFYLARLQILGKFGLREIPSGLLAAVRLARGAAISVEKKADGQGLATACAGK